MFRSTRRDIVFPQSEHARLAATIALAWGNDAFARPPLPFDSFVQGVALHDRGYAPLDSDGIGEVTSDRWLEIQRESFRPRGADAVVDLVVAMHIVRLVANSRRAEIAAELATLLPELRLAANVTEDDAAAADLVTNLCDRIAFDLCFEEAAAGEVGIAPAEGREPVRIAYRVDGMGGVSLDPWPLGVPRLCGLLFAYAAAGYPDALDPCVAPFEVAPPVAASSKS